ncbi:MAG: sigma factor [Bacteroidota bacterium]
MSEKQFLEQVRENQGIIYKLVGLYASDGEEKKDLYQEVLLQTWKAWPSFVANPNSAPGFTASV